MQALSTSENQTAPAARAAWLGDAVLALVLAVALLLLSTAQGANRLLDVSGDNDSVMRLVQVRDLLAGQSWFDLSQYRMGPAGGFEMHWSRLVDAPIAALLWVAQALTGDAGTAEMAVAYLWPGLLLATALFLIIRGARQLAGTEAVTPAAIVGLAALYFMSMFAPGSFDHHNIQLVLILLVIVNLLGRPALPAGLVAGASAALSLAIGMETVPLVAALGAAVALVFLLRGGSERPLATGFGLGFAGAAVAASLVAIPPWQWFSVTCDAWSGAQAGAAILAGAGLAVIAATPQLGATLSRRLVALALLGAALIAVSVAVFPACLADPYAGLDPLLRRYWLDWVNEAQNVVSLVADKPGKAAGFFVTPLIALGFLAFATFRGKVDRRDILIMALPLATAFAVSLWQVRGAMFAVPIAVMPLAAMVARVRSGSAGARGLTAPLLLAAAWLASTNFVWSLGVSQAARIIGGGEDRTTAVSADSCYRASDFGTLAGLPSATVLGISNLGAPILYNTSHHVLSGPYHRNTEGNLAALRALTSAPPVARAIFEEHSVGIFVHCPGNGETRVLGTNFPEGLLAGINRGEVPDWLTPVTGSEDRSLRLYRVLGR